MTFFPHKASHRPAPTPPGSLVPMRPAMMRDILWDRPVFRAPTLPNPRVAFDPLPFTAARVTHRPLSAS